MLETFMTDRQRGSAMPREFVQSEVPPNMSCT